MGTSCSHLRISSSCTLLTATLASLTKSDHLTRPAAPSCENMSHGRRVYDHLHQSMTTALLVQQEEELLLLNGCECFWIIMETLGWVTAVRPSVLKGKRWRTLKQEHHPKGQTSLLLLTLHYTRISWLYCYFTKALTHTAFLSFSVSFFVSATRRHSSHAQAARMQLPWTWQSSKHQPASAFLQGGAEGSGLRWNLFDLISPDRCM